MPTPLTDADKVLRNDTGKAIVEKLDDIANAISSGAPDNLSDLGDVNISSPTSNQALVYNSETQKWENGEVSTVGSIDDLDDVTITNPQVGEALVYNPTTQKWENGEVSTVGSIDDLDDVDTTGKAEGDSLRYNGAEWVAQPTTVKLTLAEYNALTEKAPNTRYIITDAPALEYTAEDLSYDGGTETTKQKIEENASAIGEVDEFISHLSDKCVIAGKKQASGITRVNFGVTFSSAPIVTVIPLNNTSPQGYLRTCALVSVTTTYFEFVEIATQNGSSTLINGSDDCEWIAVGNKA